MEAVAKERTNGRCAEQPRKGVVLRLDQMRLTGAGVDRLTRRVREINANFERLGVPVRLKVEPGR